MPARIGRVYVPNRIVMPAMATSLAAASGEVTAELIAYYRERARSRPGSIIVENTNVDFPAGRNGLIQLRADSDDFLPGLSRLAEAIAASGVIPLIQLNHAGLYAYHPSPVGQSRAGVVDVNSLSASEIQAVVERFAKAANRAYRAGFEGVELHAAHNYLLAQFLSPLWNRRDDIYGGTCKNRVTIVSEIIRRIRDLIGSEFPVIVRINGDEFSPGGRTLEDTLEISLLLEEAGCDALHISAGTGGDCPETIEPMSYEQGWRLYLASAIKRHVHVPVIGGGAIKEPGVAEQAVATGKVDFVAIGRAQIADPEWVSKARNGESHRIHKCISCNQCIHRRMLSLAIRCSVNPLVGREGSEKQDIHLFVLPAPRKKVVMIAGGGPSGLETAIVASKRGHRVLLYEKEAKLGGQLRAASKATAKKKISWEVDYLVDCLRGCPVEVHMSTNVDKSLVSKVSPDVLIVATGSQPVIPPIPGVSSPIVYQARQVFEDGFDVGLIQHKQIVIVGGGAVGCEVADYLSELGGRVAIVEKAKEIGLGMDPISRRDLLRRLQSRGVTLLKPWALKAIEGSAVYLDSVEVQKPMVIATDLVILAVGAVANDALGLECRSLVKEIFVVGDAKKPRRLFNAIHEGFQAGLAL